ncbi:hypothetical protein LCGC14_0488650 [marine sediment metagenome]|uniref:HTH cro/C1-type domain-containing protein n=1 Tax=marine sediment metagenome TaxID=412755 RepID=A0A0F9VFZ7_9ZZZZ
MTGADVLKLRRKLNMTQQQMADEIGSARETVAMWETSKTRKISNLAKRALARLADK